MPASKAEKAGRQFDMNGSSAVGVRPLARADRPDWARLWSEYLSFYNTSLGEEVYEHTFEALTDADTGDYAGLVAELDGRAVGLAHVIFHRHGWKTTPVCYLQDLYTEKGLRGRGVGRALIEAVYAKADQSGAPNVYWMTETTNTTARQLYDRIGRLTPFIKYEREL